MAYATPEDLYALGLPAPALAARPRTVEGVNIATGVLRLTGHGLSLDSLLQFSLEGQAAFGATANALPGSLAINANYQAVPLSGSNLFKVRPEGGAVINSLTSEPVGPFAIVVDPLAAILLSLNSWSWVIDDAIIASRGPFKVDPSTGRYHPKLTIANANLAARQFMTSLGVSNPQYRAEVSEFLNGPTSKLVDGWLVDWKAGAPLVPDQPDQTSGIADDGPRYRQGYRPAPWIRGAL